MSKRAGPPDRALPPFGRPRGARPDMIRLVFRTRARAQTPGMRTDQDPARRLEVPPGVEPGPFRGVGFAIRHVTVPSRHPVVRGSVVARGRGAGFRAGPRPFPYLPRPARTGGRQLPRPDPSSPAYRHKRSSAPLWLSYPEPRDGGQLDAPCSACRSVADGPGFEPGRPVSRPGPLAGGWFQPLTHPSL